MYKKIFFVFLFSFVFVLPTLLWAEVDQEITVYVRDLKLESIDDKYVYEQGSKLTGSFELKNDSELAINDLYYEVKLVGEFQTGGIVNGIPRLQYDSVSFGPLILRAGESRLVDFAYNLPKTIAGDDLGLEVQAKLPSGLWLGWKNIRIEVVGAMKILTTRDSYIKSGDRVYTLNEGPTLKTDSPAVLGMKISNQKNVKSPISPQVSIYKQIAEGSPLLETKLDLITVLVGQSKDFSYELPRFDGKAGTYVGILNLLDADGVQVFPAITFRYVLPGDSFVIQNVSIDKGSVREGDIVNLSVSFSGQPMDIETGIVGDGLESKRFSLNVKTFSPSGKLVVESAEDIIGNNYQTKNFALEAKESAKGMSVVIQIKDGDRVLTEYNTSVAPDEAKEKFNPLPFYLLMVVVAVGIVVFLSFKLRKSTMIAILIVMGSLGYYDITSAMSVYVSRSAPETDQVFSPGEAFNLDVTVTGTSCSNEHQKLRIYVASAFIPNNMTCTEAEQNNLFDYVLGGSDTSYTHKSGDNDTIVRSHNFSVGVNAPSTAGKHKLCYLAAAYEYGVGSGGSTVDGISNINRYSYMYGKVVVNVIPPPTNLNLSCTNNTVNASWTAPSGFNTFYFRANPGADNTSMPSSVLKNNLVTTSYSFPGQAGQTYHVWLHTKRTSDGARSEEISGNVICNAVPVVTSCSVSPATANVSQVVTWFATTTGLASTPLYSWIGDDFVNGKTGPTVAGTYSSSTPAHKYATTTMTSGTTTISVACPGVMVDGGVGSDTCSGSCGGGVTVVEQVIDGKCLDVTPSYISKPSSGRCFDGTPGEVEGGSDGPWTWICEGFGTGHQAPICSATKLSPLDPNLTCSVSRTSPPTGNIQVNQPSSWQASSSVCPDCDVRWSVDGVIEEENGDDFFDRRFDTVGEKTVQAELASTTLGVWGVPCVATSTVAQEGGYVGEL